MIYGILLDLILLCNSIVPLGEFSVSGNGSNELIFLQFIILFRAFDKWILFTMYSVMIENKSTCLLSYKDLIIKSYLLNFFFLWSNEKSRAFTNNKLSRLQNSLARTSYIIFIHNVMTSDRLKTPLAKNFFSCRNQLIDQHQKSV